MGAGRVGRCPLAAGASGLRHGVGEGSGGGGEGLDTLGPGVGVGFSTGAVTVAGGPPVVGVTGGGFEGTCVGVGPCAEVTGPVGPLVGGGVGLPFAEGCGGLGAAVGVPPEPCGGCPEPPVTGCLGTPDPVAGGDDGGVERVPDRGAVAGLLDGGGALLCLGETGAYDGGGVGPSAT